MTTKQLLALAGIICLFSNNAAAQCSATITNTGKGCAGDTLKIKVAGATMLRWKKGTTIVSTLTNVVAAKYGKRVAGHDTLPGSDSTHLNTPAGVFVDKHGNVYVADVTNNRIQKWAPGAKYGITVGPSKDTLPGKDSLHLNSPSDVYVDDSDHVYVADLFNSRVQKYVPGAKYWVTVAGNKRGIAGTDSAHLDTASSIWLDKHKNIYIADYLNNRIQKWAPGAKYGVTVAGKKNGTPGSDSAHLASPIWVRLDTSGNIYISDLSNSRVQKWAPGAKYGITVAGVSGVSGSDSAHLSFPFGIYIDKSNNVYVADNSNNRVQEWLAGSSYGITVAGQSNGTYGGDSTLLNGPEGIFVDSAGGVFIGDAYNNRVMKWSADKQNLRGTYAYVTAGPGAYTAVVTDSTGCMAISNSITLKAASNTALSAATCAGKAYNYNGSKYVAAGTYKMRYSNKAGCDSTVALTLTVNPNVTVDLYACLPHGSSYSFNGKKLTTGGLYSDTLSTVKTLCDSINILHLTAITDSLIFSHTAHGCVGDTLNATISNATALQVVRNGHIVFGIYNNTPSAFGKTVAGQANGLPGTDSTTLQTAAGIYVDKGGNIYVVDVGNNRVQKWAPGAKYGITLAGDKTGVGGNDSMHLNTPYSVFVDKAGNIYITDGGNNRVQKWAPGAKYGVTVAGNVLGISGVDSASLNTPIGLYVDENENLYVADAVNNRVQKWAPGARYGITVAGDKLGRPGSDSLHLTGATDVFVDNRQNIYVADNSNNRVQMYAPGAKYGVTVAGQADGSFGTDSAHLYNPTFIYVDSRYNVYVSDGSNNRVQEWPAHATSGINIAGQSNGSAGYDSTSLSAPYGIWVDSAGAVYVGDYLNNRVQKWKQNIHNLTGTYKIVADTIGMYSAQAAYAGGCTTKGNNIKIYGPTTAALTINVCPGVTSLYYNHTTYTTSGSYTSKFMNAHGCDSTVALNVKFLTLANKIINDTIKGGKPITINKIAYHLPGTYVDTVASPTTHCDSVILRINIVYATGINNLNASQSRLSLYPNPGDGHFAIDIVTNNHTDKALVQILNLLGQVEYATAADNVNGNLHIDIHNATLSAGVYFVKVLIGAETRVARLVVQR